MDLNIDIKKCFIAFLLLTIYLLMFKEDESFCPQNPLPGGVYGIPANFASCDEIQNKSKCLTKTNCKWSENKCKYYGER